MGYGLFDNVTPIRFSIDGHAKVCEADGGHPGLRKRICWYREGRPKNDCTNDCNLQRTMFPFSRKDMHLIYGTVAVEI